MRIKNEKDMIAVIVENSWSSSSHSCGWGNGYVAVHRTHPCYGMHYSDVDVDVHGGLTFSEKAWRKKQDNQIATAFNLTQEEAKDYWIFGFDTSHLYDNKTDQNRHYVKQETIFLFNQLEKMK